MGDNAAMVTAAAAAAALAAIDKVTKTKYGAVKAAAKTVTEAAVKWVKKPTATGGAKQLTLAGSVDVASYVYCAVSKTASRIRMLNATNASNATRPAASAAATKFTIQRYEASTGKLAFSLVFSGLAEGKSY